MPLVSIIVPCYNEQATIQSLLQGIVEQSFPPGDMEVILADGMSTDRTRLLVAEFQARTPGLLIRVVDNPRRIIPAAVNVALAAARGQYIIRLDAHSVPDVRYVEQCVADLRAGLGDNVGGVWKIQPGGPGWVAKSIAAAAAHPFGVGDALYRFTSQAGQVDTVPFGAFHREVFDRIGKFDETLPVNEDYEFNTRLRERGGRIWLDPQIQSVYFSRATLGALARQYGRYGYWKVRMLKRYAKSLRWRQALPPVFVLSLAFLVVLALFWPLARWALLAELLLYFGALAAGSFPVALQKKDLRLLIGMPLAMMTMHLSWGSGFLWSFISGLFIQKANESK